MIGRLLWHLAYVVLSDRGLLMFLLIPLLILSVFALFWIRWVYSG